MTDNKDDNKDVVVNLFKDKSAYHDNRSSKQIPKNTLHKLVIDQLDRVKEDGNKHKATGVITILFDDKGPLV